MKKSSIMALSAVAIALGSLPLVMPIAETIESEPAPALGMYTVDFDSASDIDKFDLYSSFGKGFEIVNDCLWTNRSGEQKAILKSMTFTDLTVQADLVTPVDNAYIDGGFYIGVTGDVANPVDCINAYQVCVLRGGTHSVSDSAYPGCTVKIYKFTYRNGISSYQFIKEGSAIAPHELSIKATVTGNELSVYVCGNEDAALTYTMPDYQGGKIGLRTFYCQMGYDNFKVYSSVLETDTDKFDELIVRAENIAGGYTEHSKSALDYALSAARAAKSGGNQYEIDDACVKLEKAINALTRSHDFSSLGELIARAEKLDKNKYTANSYASLMSVLNHAKALSDTASEQEISVACERLNGCIEDLTELLEDKA